MEKKYDILVIGGGAAGFFAAVNAAAFSPGMKIAIIEKSGKILQKVLVSGGGRCNVTHACFDNKELITNYPRGGKELLGPFSKFSTGDTIDWFYQRGVEMHTEEDGRMFPVTDDSRTIAQCLLTEAEENNVEIIRNTEIVRFEKQEKNWKLTSKNSEEFFCRKLLIAHGGSPKLSSYDHLGRFGHSIIPPMPSLFTFNMPGNKITSLMGVSVEHAIVKIKGTSIETSGPLLITHWGMSGPAILKASSFGAREIGKRNYQFRTIISWCGLDEVNDVVEEIEATRKNEGAQTVFANTKFNLPRRLWQFLVHRCGIDDEMNWADMKKTQIEKLAAALAADEYEVNGKTTFKEEFVTCGGVSLKEIDFRTMESTIVKDLYFAGEVLDIDAVTGGFNFQAAWTTGWLAAKGMTT
ncbi:MAG TPA: NAD(P)/FAD-dependent oxidoreductase [Bacteroidia bacterium]|jgi:predicted Rossmann fold flavoprotein|nr:NAD(P)/FAD-dependent oxidoreductase [Bacteroidia bacterium]